MSGSTEEERIRGAVEAELRLRFPDARIVHELMLEQGGRRIDLAAVTADRLIVAEVKSEKDVLERLAGQVADAVLVAQEVWVVVAVEHGAEIAAAQSEWTTVNLREPGPYGATTASFANPQHIPQLRHCHRFMEADGRLITPCSADWGSPYWPPEPAATSMLNMLWANELRTVCGAHRITEGSTRQKMIVEAVELMTGREVRRAVCAALRARPFPRADAPVGRAAA